MAQTDVKLVIKAQNEASAAVTAIADAIKNLTGAQDKLKASGGATASLLDQLKGASTALAAAVQKTDDAVARASIAFEKQQKTLAETEASLAAVKGQMAATEVAAAKLNAQFNTGPQIQKYTVQLAGLTAEQKNLSTQAKILTSDVVKQQAAMEKAAVALRDMQSASRASGSAATFSSASSGQGKLGLLAGAAAGVREMEAAIGAAAKFTAAQLAEAKKGVDALGLSLARVGPEQLALASEGTIALGLAADASRRLASALPPIAPAAVEATVATRSLWVQLKELGAAMLAVPGEAAAAGTGVSSFAGRSSAATQATHLFRYELLSLAFAFVGPYGVVMAIGSVLKSYQDLQTAQNKLGVVFNQNNAQVSKELDFLRETAVRLGFSFQQLADQYATISISAQDAGLSLEQNRKLFLSVAEAARVLHLSGENVDRVFLAFREMMSKGVLYSKQLQNQLGNDIPGAVKLFADALNLSEQQLNKLMRSGQLFVDSEMMTKVADRLTEKYGKQLPQALESVQTQIGRFKALLEIAEQKIGGSGFIDGVVNALRDFNKELQSSSGQTVFTEIGTALGKMAGIIPAIVHNFGLITLALKAWVTIKLTSWVFGLISSFNALYLKLDMAIAKMTTVAAVARAMWAAISGIVVGAAVFGLETLLGNWLTGIDGATTALEEHQKVLDAVRKGYEDAGGAVDGWAKKIQATTALQVKANLAQLQAQLATMKASLPLPSIDRSSAGDSAIVGKTGILGAVIPNAAADQLRDIIQKFKDGKISVDEFRASVSKFGETAPSDLKALALQILNATDKAKDLNDAVKQTQALLRVVQGKGTAADIKALGLDQAEGWKTAGNALDQFHDKLRKLGDLAPDLKKQFKFDDQLTQATQIYADLMEKAAGDPGLMAQAMQMYNRVVAKIHAEAATAAAKDFPVDNKAIIERIIYIESKGSSTAKNPNSTALGIGQFTKETWLSILDQMDAFQNLSEAAKLSLRTNDSIARQALEVFTRQNQVALANAGIDPNATNTYLAHFLGASGAIKMILANPDELASKIASKESVSKNQGVLGGGKTAGDVLAWAQSKMGGVSPITSTGETELEKVNADLDASIQKWKDEKQAVLDSNEATKKFGDGAARALFIQGKINDEAKIFKDAGGFLPAERVNEITQAAGELYDVQHAAENAKKSVSDVLGLIEQRATAVGELKTAMSDGSDAATIQAIRDKVVDLNQQIAAGLPAAQAWAAALGDEKLVATLDKAVAAMARLKIGLTDAKQMNTLLADTAVSAWENFNSTLATSQNIFDALRTSFLQFVTDFLSKIEEMILKQQILNALSGTGVGDWLSKLVNGATGTDGAGGAQLSVAGTQLQVAATQLMAAATMLMTSSTMSGLDSIIGASSSSGSFLDIAQMLMGEMHTGGIVGKDGKPRYASAAIFAGAKRFHSGGLPGLRSNEIPTILQKGEEVLTRGDPRHALNGGAKTAVHLKNVNVFDPADAFEAGLNSTVGEQTMFNFVRRNKMALKATLA